MDLEGQSVIVVGMGESGKRAAELAQALGARVTVTDDRPASAFAGAFDGAGYELRFGGKQGVPFDAADCVVVSPGVPDFPALHSASRVVSELEFASWYVRFPLIAVGGTNGKSTTTLLLARLLEAAGLRVFAGGNLGVPLSAVAREVFDVGVVEVSSFQLERLMHFRPQVSVLLNVSEDHLDRYADFAAYAGAKGNAFARQGPGDYAIVPAQDPVCLAEARRGQGQVVTFGAGGDYEASTRGIMDHRRGRVLSLDGVKLHGHHNLSNAAAAVAAAAAFGVSWEVLEAGLRAFEPLPHRMAFVRELDGVRYFDDSKATNVGAAVTALGGLSEERCVLIAGGRDKQGSYLPLRRALERRGRAAILIGEAAATIETALLGAVPLYRAGSMDQAVQLAQKLAQPRDAVLLSPACSSFDMYQSYAARGDDFARAVLELGSGAS